MKRWLLLVVLGLAVLIGLGLLLTRSPRYEPTGDALYDRYARHVLKQAQRHGYAAFAPEDTLAPSYGWRRGPLDTLLKFMPGYRAPKLVTRVLDFKEVLKWEPQFKDDPRYWQLRVTCGLDQAWQSPPPEHKYGTPFDSGPYVKRLLEGPADGESFACISLGPVYNEDEELCVRLLERAVELDPDNSYWHLRLALVQQSLGELELAKAELDACNSAKLDRVPYAFPYGTLFDARYAQSSAPGNRLVRGQIAAAFMLGAVPLPNYIRIKESYKEAEGMLLLGSDPAYADALITAAGRMGRSRGNLAIGMLVASICARIPASAFASQVLSGPPAKDPRLLTLLNQSGTLRTAVRKQHVWTQVKGVTQTPFLSAYTQIMFPGLAPAAAAPAQYTGSGTPASGSSAGASPAGNSGAKAPATPSGLPALSREDWLNFSLIFDEEDQYCQSCAPLFDVYSDPPLAEIYREVEAGTYQAPGAEDGEADAIQP